MMMVMMMMMMITMTMITLPPLLQGWMASGQGFSTWMGVIFGLQEAVCRRRSPAQAHSDSVDNDDDDDELWSVYQVAARTWKNEALRFHDQEGSSDISVSREEKELSLSLSLSLLLLPMIMITLRECADGPQHQGNQ